MVDVWKCHCLAQTFSNFHQVSTLPSLHVCLASPLAKPSIVLLPFVIQLTPHHRHLTLVLSDVVPILSRRSYLPPQLATFYFVSSPCVIRTPRAMGCGCSLCIPMTNGTEAATAWRRFFSADCLNTESFLLLSPKLFPPFRDGIWVIVCLSESALLQGYWCECVWDYFFGTSLSKKNTRTIPQTGQHVLLMPAKLEFLPENCISVCPH